MSALANPEMPPDTFIAMLLPTLWTGFAGGREANVCVDACRILQHAYGQFGMPSELRAVELDVIDRRGRVIHHAPEPSWDGDVLDGHCIVYLPDDQRFIDATVEQYRHLSHLRFGIVVGRIAGYLGGGTGTGSDVAGGRLPAGARMVVQRGDVTLEYILADDAATALIVSHSCVADNVEGHRRAGINLASLAIETLRRTGSLARARTAPYPRLHALLEAIGDAPAEADEAGDWFFSLTGDDGNLRRLPLDEIPLLKRTPPAADEKGSIGASSMSLIGQRGKVGWRPWRRAGD